MILISYSSSGQTQRISNQTKYVQVPKMKMNEKSQLRGADPSFLLQKTIFHGMKTLPKLTVSPVIKRS